MTISYLTEAPFEIVEEILSYLHPCSIAQCRILSRGLKLIVDNSTELQLRIELGVDGYLMEWPLPRSISAREMLEVVFARRQAFEESKPFETWSLDAPRESQYEISNGVLGFGIRPSPHGGYNGIKYEHLHPMFSIGRRDAVGKENFRKTSVLYDDLKPRMADFSFSFDDNLQVLIGALEPDHTRTIYFRTIDTNEPHPEAASSQIVFTPQDGIVRTKCLTLLSYAHISFSLYAGDEPSAHVIYNWRTGEYAMPYQIVDDVAFLNEQFALLVMYSENKPSLSLYSLDQRQVQRRFLLPFRYPLRSAYFTTGPPKRARPPSNEGDNPFHSMKHDPKVEILGLEVLPMAGRGGDSLYAVISIDGLLRMAQVTSRGKESSDDSYKADIQATSTPPIERASERVDIEWDEWGPLITRWFSEDEIYDTNFRCISGSRLLLRHYNMKGTFGESRVASEGKKEGITIFDFNLRPAMRRELTQDEAVDNCDRVVDGTEVIREKTDLEVTENWKHAFDLISSLPYRVIELPTFPSNLYYEYYLDEHTILGRDDTRYDVYSFYPIMDLGNKDAASHDSLAIAM